MSHSTSDALASLQHSINGKSIAEAVETLIAAYPGAVTFSTSFSNEDQVITDHIAKNHLPVSFFTLDTGRLFPETYSTWSRTLEHYSISIKAYYPNAGELETFIESNGPNAFYDSVELRSRCCFIRKVTLYGSPVCVQNIRPIGKTCSRWNGMKATESSNFTRCYIGAPKRSATMYSKRPSHTTLYTIKVS